MADFFNVCYSLPDISKVWRCATVVSLLKPGKPCRLVTTKLSSNITLVHYSQTGRVSILMRILIHGGLLLSYQESVSSVDKVMKLNLLTLSTYWKASSHGVSSQTPHRLVTLFVKSSLLKLHKQISNPIVGWDMLNWIHIQIPSANAAEARAIGAFQLNLR